MPRPRIYIGVGFGLPREIAEAWSGCEATDRGTP